MTPKIHLIMSVYLTDVSLNPENFYGKIISPNQNKVDQFLSTLHSLHKINFTSAEIHFELSEKYFESKNYIVNQIRSYIPIASIHFTRLEYFQQWKIAANRVPSDTDIILLKNNHDHVFVPNNSTNFYQYINDILGYKEDFVGEISHWPESIGNLRSGKWENTPNMRTKYFLSTANVTIGTCVITPSFFKSWWIKDFTDGSRIVRPDNPFGPWVKFQAVKRVVPTTEFFRHLDGYGHAKVSAPIASPLRPCCEIKNNNIIHTDWLYGQFYKKKGIDLPDQPELTQSNPTSILLDQALLASAYKVNLSNLWNLSNSFRYKFGKVSFLLLTFCLLDKHFIRKLLNLFLPKYNGNILLFKLRMLYVNKYQFIRKKNNKLPPSVKDLVLFRFNKRS